MTGFNYQFDFMNEETENKKKLARRWWLAPVILAAKETEIERIVV
jgi:hypothetical protein